MAATVGAKYSKIWNLLYKELKYKYHIDIKRRGSKPYIQHIEENEWGCVTQSFSAICEVYGVSPTEMFQEICVNDGLNADDETENPLAWLDAVLEYS